MYITYIYIYIYIYIFNHLTFFNINMTVTKSITPYRHIHRRSSTDGTGQWLL